MAEMARRLGLAGNFYYKIKNICSVEDIVKMLKEWKDKPSIRKYLQNMSDRAGRIMSSTPSPLQKNLWNQWICYLQEKWGFEDVTKLTTLKWGEYPGFSSKPNLI